MNSPVSFTRFVYFDTNIYSHLAKNISLWNPLLKFLLTNDLCNSFSSANLAELADATTLHNNLVDFMLCMPTCVIKTWDMILLEEVTSHPNNRADNLLLDPIIRLAIKENGHNELKSFFTSRKLRFARKEQLRYASQISIIHERFKKNFPPTSSGKYTRHQADEFAEFIVFQWLAFNHFNFINSFKDHVSDLNTSVFQSVRLFGLVIFYKYYLGNRNINKLSDFGDLAHLCFLPYCNLVIIERDLCNILNQIKKNHNILQTTIILNMDFFVTWEYS